MNNYTIKKYDVTYYHAWNQFVSEAKNATFLFHRDFMEYHSDRFEDYSLLVFEGEKLVAVLPANKKENVVYSHQGLTYGGFIFKNDLGGFAVGQLFQFVLIFLKNAGFTEFNLKQIPEMYHAFPSNEIEYFLFQKNASLERRDMNLAIDFSLPLKISKSKLKHFRKTETQKLKIVEENDFESFWNDVLIPRLQLKHNAKPVHTVEEITKLKKLFPKNIRQFNAYSETEIVAGITLFLNKNVVKSQYGATSEKGQAVRALDFLFIHLIHSFKDEVSFFDMGIVNENNGLSFNGGLLKQKEELGCSIYSQDYYKIKL